MYNAPTPQPPPAPPPPTGMREVGMHRPAFQSTNATVNVSGVAATAHASLAVDGLVQQNLTANPGACAMTNGSATDRRPWWWVGATVYSIMHVP